jgi:hypothetical protein
MKSESPNNQSAEKTRWPLGQMLMRGTFNTGTRAEKRLTTRSYAILILFLVWGTVVKAFHVTPLLLWTVTPFLPAIGCTYFAWEKRKYFLSLDELPRRIEMEGMAWAYSLGVLAALWMGAIGYAVSLHYRLDPKLLAWAPFFLFAMLLATVKGAYRYFATRRY